MPTYTYGGVTIRSNTDLTPKELEQAFDSYKSGAVSRGDAKGSQSMEPATDKPLEQAFNPVEEVLTGVGIAGGAGIMKALSQIGRRTRFSPSLGEDVVGAVAKAAPGPLKPTSAGVEGLSTVMRSGGGRAALRKSREEGIGGLYNEVLTAEKAAVSEVPGRADKFKKLITELADANRAAYNPVTADARTGALSLKPQRERAAILQELQQTLTPEQWTKFQALQDEYAQGSNLMRLFKAKETGKDVLQDRGALQKRAIAMQDKVDPELLRKILPGGPLQTDKQISGLGIPLLRNHSPIPLPEIYWRAAGPSALEDLLTMLGGAGGGALSQYLRHNE